MRKTTKITCLLLALIFVIVGLVSCGDKPAETTATAGTQGTPAETTTGRGDMTDEVPADLNFKDLSETERTITFFVRNNKDIWKYEMACDELRNDVLYDAIHYRNIDMENRLGCKIATIAEPGVEVGREYVDWNKKFTTAVQTKTHDYDGCTFFSYCGSTMALNGVFLDLSKLSVEEDGYFDFEKPWWNKNIIDNLSVYGSLFMVGGDLLPSEIVNTFCVFFNKTLFDQKFPTEKSEKLYKLVNDYQWTVDKMVEYVDKVWEDKNGDGERNDGDVIGWQYSSTVALAHWFPAFNMTITSKDEFGEIQLDLIGNPNALNAFEAIQKLFVNNGGVFGDSTYEKTDMKYGNQMFCQTCFSAGETMRGAGFKYGVLTYPMLNEDQHVYKTGIQGSASLLALASDLTPERASMISAVLEVMAADSYRRVTPSYYETVLQGIYSDDEPDAQMYDRLIEGNTFDFSSVFFPKISALSDYGGTLLRHFDGSFDIAQTLQENKTKWETALEELLSALEDVALAQ